MCPSCFDFYQIEYIQFYSVSYQLNTSLVPNKPYYRFPDIFIIVWNVWSSNMSSINDSTTNLQTTTPTLHSSDLFFGIIIWPNNFFGKSLSHSIFGNRQKHPWTVNELNGVYMQCWLTMQHKKIRSCLSGAKGGLPIFCSLYLNDGAN